VTVYVNVLKVLLLYTFAVVVRIYFKRNWIYCTLYIRRHSTYIFAIAVPSIYYSQSFNYELTPLFPDGVECTR